MPMLPGAATSFGIADMSCCLLYRCRIRRIRFTPDGGRGVYERVFARLEGHGPSKEKEDVEVALLKIHAKICEEDLITMKAASKRADIAIHAAQIANLKSIMETRELGEEMADCRKKSYKLATKLI